MDCLIDQNTVRDRFTTVIFSDSHGAFDGFLGAGYLYYSFASAIRSQVSVCIGSGGGFIPGLLVQAQRDLRLCPAATYLIDANLPDLGFGSPVQPGGFLRPENKFLEHTPELIVLPMLSTSAAALFARQGLQIDYLHIDGDHSRRGTIADFEDFAPLLSARGIVSLHDLNLTAVRSAIGEILQRHPDWDCLRFAEIGAGTAFMRRRPPQQVAILPLSTADFVDRDRHVRLDPRGVEADIAEDVRRAKFERWHYLETPAYRSRYTLIADRIDRPGGTVVEIGGYPNSVINVLRASSRLLALEPYAPQAYVQQIEKLAAERGIEFFLSPSTVGAPLLDMDNVHDFALVWLGLDVIAGCDSLEEFSASLRGLLRLAGRAAVVALEMPGYAPSVIAWKLVQQCLSPAVERDMTLDLSADPVADEFLVRDARAKRHIVIFAATRRVSDEHDEKIEKAAAALYEIKQRQTPEPGSAAPVNYKFGGSELPSTGGTSPDGIELVARPEVEQPGFLTFGPYIRLEAGEYRLKVQYASPATPDVKVGGWDVCVGSRELVGQGSLLGTGGEAGEAIATFMLSPEHAPLPIEMRTLFDAVAELRIIAISVEKIDIEGFLN